MLVVYWVLIAKQYYEDIWWWYQPPTPTHHSVRKVSQDLSCGSGGHLVQQRTVNYEILNLMMIQTGNNYLTREGSSHLHTVFLGINIWDEIDCIIHDGGSVFPQSGQTVPASPWYQCEWPVSSWLLEERKFIFWAVKLSSILASPLDPLNINSQPAIPRWTQSSVSLSVIYPLQPYM